VNLHPKFLEEVYGNLAADCWNPAWSQVPRFGGGMAVELEVGEFLHALARLTKPETVVETGTHRGFSTLMLAQALRANGKGHLYTVDVVDYGVVADCERFGVADRVTFLQGNSAEVLARLPGAPTIDLLWLDADHAAEAVHRELEVALPLLRAGTLVAFHDTTSDPREGEAVREIRAQHPTWEAMDFVTARGFALLRVVDG